MVDYFSLALIHGLLVLMIVRLSNRPELDRESLPTDEDRPGA